MKKVIIILFILFNGFHSFAQTDTNTAQPADTGVRLIQPVTPKPEIKRVKTDTLKTQNLTETLQIADSTINQNSVIPAAGSPKALITDTLKILQKRIVVKKPIDSIYLKLLNNPFLRSKAKPIYLVINERKRTSKDEIFYLLLGLLLLLAFIKLVFNKYFKKHFQVIFSANLQAKANT